MISDHEDFARFRRQIDALRAHYEGQQDCVRIAQVDQVDANLRECEAMILLSDLAGGVLKEKLAAN